MKKRFLACMCCAVIAVSNTHSYAQVTEQTIKNHVYYLASKELNGRIAGTDEGRLAAEYIANEFKSVDLSFFSDSSQYFQDFRNTRTFVKTSKLIIDNDTTNIVHLNKNIHFVEEANYIIKSLSGGQSTIVADSSVLRIVKANHFDEGMQLIKQLSLSGNHGSGYMLLLPGNKQKSFKLGQDHLKKSNNSRAVYVHVAYLQFSDDKEVTEAYLKELAHLNIFVGDENPVAKHTNHFSSDAKVQINEQQDSLIIKEYRNVIAKIEGSKPELPAIVFCAHYDHVNSFYSRKVKNPQTDYFPGADDNASGTAAVIEIAKQLKISNYQPEQTTYFCLFDAEEVGLVGSRYFAEQLGQEVDFVINMDMIGRNKRDRKSCDDVIFAKAKGSTARDFNKGFDKYTRHHTDSLKIRRFEISFLLWLTGYPSDQLSFRPDSDASVFYTGLHDDYHTHNDTPDKINYPKLTEYVNMMSRYLMQRSL